MNIKKPVDYSTMYRELTTIPAKNLPQMIEIHAIGKVISQRPEKGAAVAAAEFLQANFPDRTGFSPRNVRRMRDFYKTYENDQTLLQLAMKIGLNEAIVLQQLHYWLRDTNSGMECDGVRWIYNTTEQWLEQFPFWSESTLKRAFASLKTLGLLRCEKLNKSKRDMTNFYTINYGSELLDGGKLNESIGSKCAAPSGQNDTMEEVKMKRSIGSKRSNVIGSKWPDDLTENTTEITTENKNTFRPEASQPDPQTTEQDFLTRNSDAVVFSAKKRQWGSQEDLACAQWIWGRIVSLYEQAASDDGEIMRPKEPNWTAWANDVRTMRMLDGRSHRQICEMFSRAQRDPFWIKNIKSPEKLREKWDELVIRLWRGPAQRCVNHISEPDTEIPPGFRG